MEIDIPLSLDFALQLKGELSIRTLAEAPVCPALSSREPRMQKETMKRQEWIKPQLTRLGEIKDVAGPGQTLLNQTSANKT